MKKKKKAEVESFFSLSLSLFSSFDFFSQTLFFFASLLSHHHTASSSPFAFPPSPSPHPRCPPGRAPPANTCTRIRRFLRCSSPLLFSFQSSLFTFFLLGRKRAGRKTKIEEKRKKAKKKTRIFLSSSLSLPPFDKKNTQTSLPGSRTQSSRRPR